MRPAELRSSTFAAYPPQGRKVADEQLALLQELPLVLVPILLRELIAYDWKFPAERRELERQFEFLSKATAAQRSSVMEGFRGLSPSPEVASTDWVNDPSGFMEKLTAWLWSTHQMDRFRQIADTYAAAVDESLPAPPPRMPRLGLVVIGAEVTDAKQHLFRKLRPHGVHLSKVKPDDGLAIVLAEASRRAGVAQEEQTAARAPGRSYDHWYIDGGLAAQSTGVIQVSYAKLERPRALLLERIQRAIASGSMGPEELRSLLARLKPSEIGLGGEGSNAVVDHFQLTLLTEGAGTQIFATTFAQWAARECVRRAQPETLVVRYAPRQQAQTMNTMLSGTKPIALDTAGSLVDADMGAYYTWLSMRRLTGASSLRFVVWFEGHQEAIVVGPDLPRGTTSDSPLDMQQVLALVRS